MTAPNHPQDPTGTADDCNTPTVLPPFAAAPFANLPGVAAAGPPQPVVFGAGAPLTDKLYLQEPGDSAPVSVDDLHQGDIGDCFLISSIGELALTHPSAITGMIHSNPNGTETVRLYTAGNGRLATFGTTSFRPVEVTVTNSFPDYSVNGGATQDVVAGQKEIWPQVLEKAVATLEGGYGAIAYGGNPVPAMEELTGAAATYLSPASLTLSELQGFVSAGDLITMDTPSQSNLPDNLVGSHAYMFEGVSDTNGTEMVTLGNPWGYDQPTAIPLAQLSRGIAEVDVGHFA
jgi:hypothetical protein